MPGTSVSFNMSSDAADEFERLRRQKKLKKIGRRDLLIASVFWTRRFAAVGGEQAMIEFWQVRRDGGKRGIIEIVEEEA
ncbi:MAG TPA: hypothetical protein VF278_04795 [Pirellulales bacterium]